MISTIGASGALVVGAAPSDPVSPLDYLKSEGAIRLVRAYSQIADSKVRYAVVQIVEHMAQESAPRRRRNSKK